ncbi:hypothetical protein TWF481_004825 [Arthrobotrys musiformis]|uniref:Uncharacterized protein n=1 Tax=Arthrobotrys musiformis TaxID=47236 RepID=A0AAV9WMB0_9PEZI
MSTVLLLRISEFLRMFKPVSPPSTGKSMGTEVAPPLALGTFEIVFTGESVGESAGTGGLSGSKDLKRSVITSTKSRALYPSGWRTLGLNAMRSYMR